MFYGVVPRFRKLGIDALLFSDVWDYSRARGYRTCENSMLLEDNVLVQRAGRIAGSRHYKTWRIYETDIAQVSPA
jgi:GNAT superfamily N-acetyltransferase